MINKVPIIQSSKDYAIIGNQSNYATMKKFIELRDYHGYTPHKK